MAVRAKRRAMVLDSPKGILHLREIPLPVPGPAHTDLDDSGFRLTILNFFYE